jgi:hypothetical protein
MTKREELVKAMSKSKVKPTKMWGVVEWGTVSSVFKYRDRANGFVEKDRRNNPNLLPLRVVHVLVTPIKRGKKR